MNEYSQAIMGDGALILKNGKLLTIEEIVSELNTLNEIGLYALHYREETLEHRKAKTNWDELNKK